MEQIKYDVFISYSRKDYVDEQMNVIPGNAVSKVKDALTAAGITYWFDNEGMYSGDNFTEKIVSNIEISQIFVFLSTENANKSRWTCKEIASADEFGKYIIPVRIDRTPYNKKVMFRIADLSYIDYYQNPEKGINDLIASIKAYLAQIQEEANRKKAEEEKKREAERRKAEEEKRKREEEEKLRQKQQQELINNIKLECTAINNEESMITLSRMNLVLKAEKIIDKEIRCAIKEEIVNSSPIRKKCKEEYEKGKQSVDNLYKEQLASYEKKIEEKGIIIYEQNEKLIKINEQLNACIEEKKNLEHTIVELREQLKDSLKKNKYISKDSRLVEENAIKEDEDTTAVDLANSNSDNELINVDKYQNKNIEIPIGQTTIRMNRVEQGVFKMGATREQIGAYPDEVPVHEVTLNTFYIGETLVTKALWDEVMNGTINNSDLPVTNVSWDECLSFIQKLNLRTGRTFRLPTEAEWEYAARGGDMSNGTIYAGSNNIDVVAWHKGNSKGEPHPVKLKKANELGLFDMNGNVMEWCQDWYDSYPKDPQKNPVRSTQYQNSIKKRVLRGGSWDSEPFSCRTSSRFYLDQNRHNKSIGLRLAMDM